MVARARLPLSLSGAVVVGSAGWLALLSLPRFKVCTTDKTCTVQVHTATEEGGFSPTPARNDPGNDVHEIAPATPPSQSRAVFCTSPPPPRAHPCSGDQSRINECRQRILLLFSALNRQRPALGRAGRRTRVWRPGPPFCLEPAMSELLFWLPNVDKEPSAGGRCRHRGLGRWPWQRNASFGDARWAGDEKMPGRLTWDES